MTPTTRAATALVASTFALPAMAEEVKYMADLQPAEGVESTGKGLADVTVDTTAMTISWTLAYEGLTGDPVAAHFHGPADPGAEAPPVIDMSVDATETEGEAIPEDIKTGSSPITAEQLADLQAGKWYVNVHTEANPNGEIRGQVMPGTADMSTMEAAQ